MYLVDTNVWLERLLGRARAQDVAAFLSRTPSDQLAVSDFSFHSIGIILLCFGRADLLRALVSDIFVTGATNMIRPHPADTEDIVASSALYQLDFDDAYQYVAARKFDLTLVSLDSDFDRTDRGRKTPAQAR